MSAGIEQFIDRYGQPLLEVPFLPSTVLLTDLDANGYRINNLISRFTPEAYGAKADGVTDDSAAFSSAITDAIAAGNSQVELAKGKTYALKQSGVEQQVLVTGGTPTTKLYFIGNGATIYYQGTSASGNYYPACFQFRTEFHTISFEGINFVRPRQQLVYINRCIQIQRVSNSAAKSSLIRVRDCYFENSPSALWVGQGGSSMASRFTLARVEFINNRVVHPWASDSSGGVAGPPRVGCYASIWAETFLVDGNYFDGGADITLAPTGNLQMDGLAISDSLHTIFRRNTVKYVGYEGGILQAAQGQICANNTAFTMPAVGSDVSITYAQPEPDDEIAYFTVGATVYLLNGNDPYGAAGQFTIQAVDTTANTMTIRNTGAPNNHAPGGLQIGSSFIGIMDPYAGNATCICEENDLDQVPPIGQAHPHGTSLLSLNHGHQTVRNNTLRNVTSGIAIGPAGANIIGQFPGVASGSLLQNNEINFLNWVNDGVMNAYTGILVTPSCPRVNIIGNVGKVDVSTGTNFIDCLSNDSKVLNNAFKADSLVYNAAHPSVAYIHGNGTTGIVMDGNYAENVDYAIGPQVGGGANVITIGGLTAINCLNRILVGGAPIYLPSWYRRISFTPTTIGWYRVISAGGTAGGHLRVTGAYNNKVTDFEVAFDVRGYGTGPGDMQQLRFLGYNGGHITQVRTSSNGSGATYLDLYVADVTTPAPFTMELSGLLNTQLVDSPVVGAAVGSTDAVTVTLGNGFRTNIGLYVAGNQLVGARGAAVADATDAASAITQLNALLARARAHGLIA